MCNAMNRKALNLKCPVCGMENQPIQVDIDRSWSGDRVLAKYECRGVRKRLFRKPEPCAARYAVTLDGIQADRLIQKLYGNEGEEK